MDPGTNDPYRPFNLKFLIPAAVGSVFSAFLSMRRRNVADGDLGSAWRTLWVEERDGISVCNGQHRSGRYRNLDMDRYGGSLFHHCQRLGRAAPHVASMSRRLQRKLPLTQLNKASIREYGDANCRGEIENSYARLPSSRGREELLAGTGFNRQGQNGWCYQAHLLNGNRIRSI